jgi:hypothetical protein
MFKAPDPEADTTAQSAGTKADTAKYKRRAHKHAKYEARYARYRNFQYLALIGEYLRICSRIFHLKVSTQTHHSTPTRRRLQSVAARPSAAEKGGLGVSVYNAHSTLTRTRKPGAVEKKHYSDCNATQHAHATKQKQWRERERIQTAPGGLDLI